MQSVHRTITALIAMAAVMALGLAGFPLSAAAAESFKMGVVDPMQVMQKTKAGRRALDNLREYVATRQKVFANEEKEFKDLEKQLNDQAASLSETQKREKEEQLKAKAQILQRHFQDYNQALTVKQKEVIDEYLKKIQAATKTVAEKSGFSLVVDKGGEPTGKIVLFNKETLDITDEVIKEFDRVNK